MPLPDTAHLSLHVRSNALQSKPKRAMIVRMSAETLDALEAFPNHPPMSLDFGDNPVSILPCLVHSLSNPLSGHLHRRHLLSNASTAGELSP